MTLENLIWLAVGSLLPVILFLLWQWAFRSRREEKQVACSLDLLSGVFDAIVLLNRQGIVQYINPTAEKILRYKSRSARGKRADALFSLVDNETRAVLTQFFAYPFDLTEQLSTECLLLSGATNRSFPVEAILIPRRNEQGEFEEYLLVLKDLTESIALQSRLTYMETHDTLTRLLNRRSFEYHLRVALNEARYQEIRHVFCHISLDQHRLINDSMGHNAGDNLIVHIAEIIKEQLQKKDHYIMRLASNQFGVLLKACIPSEGLRLMDQIRSRIADYEFVWGDAGHEVTASIGFVLIFKNSANTNRIYSAADAACRVAREKGGNQLQVYRPDDVNIQKQWGHIRWAGRVKQAFKENNFRLFAQPIHRLAEKEYAKPYSHYEVLIRLYNEKGEQVSPQEFIPAAEYYSMMPQLDKWVIKEVLRYLKQITQKVPLPVFSVNLSGQSLDEEGFLKYVLSEIRAAEIRPQMLCFEITETVAITNLTLASEFIATLKELGCSFALDDFGTGMSSFEYLKKMPVDYLKIDGSFVKDILLDDVQRTMVQSMNQVGHMMGVETIAEYVENDEIINVLREIGLDYGQGYGISRPMPLEDAVSRHYL